MAIYHGNSVSIDYGSLELTDELERAIFQLDADCRFGSGGTWEIYEEEPEHGEPFRAIFVDMATDELIWDTESGTWTDGYSDDEDEDDEDEGDLAG